MREGYEFIPVTENDTEPPARRGFFDKKIAAIAAALLVLASLILFAQQSPRPEHVPKVIVLQPEEQDDVMIRPSCVSYSTDRTITVLQTSMKTPDHQWAPIPCEKAQKDKAVVELNSFGLPDAILQTNLSHIVFEHSKIKGFGGAFTEAAALNFNQLSIRGKETVMELLFGKSGLGYTLGRFPINSCKRLFVALCGARAQSWCPLIRLSFCFIRSQAIFPSNRIPLMKPPTTLSWTILIQAYSMMWNRVWSTWHCGRFPRCGTRGVTVPTMEKCSSMPVHGLRRRG